MTNSYKILLGTILIASFSACKTGKKVLEFDTPETNLAILKGDKFDVKLKFGSLSMDSVVYYLDNKVIGSRTDTMALSVPTSDLAYGLKTISARVYQSGKSDSVSTSVFVVPPAAKNYGFDVVHTFPHDTTAFTQGLQYADGIFYESCGQYGKSSLRKVEVNTGKVLKKIDFDDKTFAEGMTLVGDKLVMLTWQQMEGYVFDKNTFAKLSTFKYKDSKEGWGITYDGKRLIKSDGSNKLYFLDPHTQEEKGFISVYDENGPLDMLNELEYIDGKVYANVYEKDIIAVINPETGAVEKRINLVGIYQHTSAYDNELNGIAYDQAQKRLFVTGKLWNKLFEIKLKEQ